jgi:hypothetical protein
MKIKGNLMNELGSFRDPSGCLFWHDGNLYRRVNYSYKESYDQLMSSGLYDTLVENYFLIPQQDISGFEQNSADAYKILKPENLPFISYPYEWCFSQLKDAALLTLSIQKTALEFGMSLKDASAYNIQFCKGRPILIDTLSFEPYAEGRPWVAYRQFCQHFLAPLALMSYTDIRLNSFFRIYIDGIPLDLASRLLPARTWLGLALLLHLHLHAKSQLRYGGKIVETKKMTFSRQAFSGLIDSLETIVNKLKWRPFGTEWAEYYNDINYTDKGFEHKYRLVREFLEHTQPQSVWDLGANVGHFSTIASKMDIPAIAFDIDPGAVEKLYIDCKERNEQSILPLLLDLTNPSAGLGWANEERSSLIERGPADAVLALALIHHLAIGNNVPFDKIAEFLSRICKTLIIEFVPKHDSQVRRLLVTREDVFSKYTQQGFENAFKPYFEIIQSIPINESDRILYLMEKKNSPGIGH